MTRATMEETNETATRVELDGSNPVIFAAETGQNSTGSIRFTSAAFSGHALAKHSKAAQFVEVMLPEGHDLVEIIAACHRRPRQDHRMGTPMIDLP